MNIRSYLPLLAFSLFACATVDDSSVELPSKGLGGASSSSGGSSSSAGGSTGSDLVGNASGGASSAAGGSSSGGTASSGGSSSAGGSSSGGQTSSGGSSSGPTGSVCLLDWQSAPEASSCLEADQDDKVKGCTGLLDCWQINDCNPSSCNSGPDDTCGQNKVPNSGPGSAPANAVYSALCE